MSSAPFCGVSDPSDGDQTYDPFSEITTPEDMLRHARYFDDITIMSAYNRKVTSSLVYEPDVNEFIATWPAVDGVLEHYADRFYDEGGMERLGVAPLMPSDLAEDFPQFFPLFSESVNSVVYADPFPTVVHKDQGAEISLNCAIITEMNAHVPALPVTANILVLCAGNGEDACRLTYTKAGRVPHTDFVGASDFHPRAKLALNQFAGHRTTPCYLEDLPDGWLGTYDLILCHHGVHHLTRTTKGVAAFVNLLSNHLAVGGMFVGDFINIVGAKYTSEVISNVGSSVRLLNHDASSTPSFIEGKMTVRAGGATWTDAVLSYTRLANMIPGHLRFDICTGRDLYAAGRTSINGNPLVLPAHLKYAKSRSEAQMVSVLEVYRVPHTSLSSSSSVFQRFPENYEPAAWSLVTKALESSVSTALSFTVLKGTLAGPRDLYFMINESHLYSEKMDGIHARVVLRGSGAYALLDTGEVYYAGGINRGQNAFDVELSCEAIASPDGLRFVVNEPIRLGPYTPRCFATRLRAWMDVYREYPSISRVLVQKPWYEAYPALEADEGGWEGIVVMSPSTLPPWAKSHPFAARARYVKRVVTVDNLIGNKVFEVELDTGKAVRPRPDKAEGNSPKEVEKLKEAIPWRAVATIMTAPTNWDVPGVLSVLRWFQGGFKGPNPSPSASLTLLRRKWEGLPSFALAAGLAHVWGEVLSNPLMLARDLVPRYSAPHQFVPDDGVYCEL